MSEFPRGVLIESAWSALGGAPELLEALNFKQDGALPSAFSVSEFAASSIGVAALAIAELVALQTASLPRVMIDRRLASAWFRWSLRPVGWALPQPWDSIAGDYRTQDGWIRLHTNAPHHRAAALQVLGVPADRDAVTAAVAPWSAVALETAIIEAGGCAAEMRSIDAWTNHPQGRAVAEEKLAATTYRPAPSFTRWQPDPARPLAGLKILDLTRVLAGPIATRFLAGFGATVLRIDPPGWDEPGVVPEVTLGKRCARLDLTQPADRAILTSLLEQADILIHGYQLGALERLGFGEAERLAITPHLSDVTLSAYGWSGPWAGRRGFDSLVQMSAGIADAGMRWKAADRPIPLPVQALDHATGYLMAAAAVRAVTTRLRGDGASTTKFSLARTAKALLDAGPASKETAFAEETEADLAPSIEETAWGQARRLTPPVQIDGVDLRWSRPATALGSAAPAWSGHD